MEQALPPPSRRSEEVPVKTILATIGLVIATYLSWRLVVQLTAIIQLIVVAVFFALVLNPAVDLCEQRLKMSRGLSATCVFLVGLALFCAMLYLFIRPLVDQTQQLIDRFPHMVQDARDGKGAIGHLVTKYDLDMKLAENETKLREAVSHSTGSILTVASAVASTIASALTVMVLSFMMLLYGRDMVRAPLVLFPRETAERISRVAADAARSVTGYTAGNLLISVIAGVVTFVSLEAFGVNFAVVLAVWVAFADLIPLVGATMGAIPTIAVAALHSPTAGIGMFIVYVIYQQVENHLIQPAVMSRTVNLNPLIVLISVLIGVDLAGILGALLAIPVAGIIQVVGRDLFDNRHHLRPEPKAEPTVGQSATPISQTDGGS